ncbi:MAG: D-alanyl-D-alanine carboxypeptidase [Deltaproteobacteria bacterium]|nr:D-alanyl-D-alanine carboxypeptidase [Deltaproteobacteria bacterium]
MKQFIISILIVFLAVQITWAGRAPVKKIARDPYASAIMLNAETGEVLFAENADATVYPASVLKLMVLYVVLDRVEKGTLQLSDMVQVTREASRMGGSQVYLDPKEQFSVEELLYALMVQSANDAAVALATHVAGSKESFVALMNQKAGELGMKNSHFHSVHGLPPGAGQKVDVTTARDFGILCRELVRHPKVFKYTGTRVRDFRQGQFVMRNHNHLLENVDGCDGFKTGYFTAAGFSIAATAKRGGNRIIAIVMGSKDRKVRDARATQLLAKGFSMVPAKSEPVVAAAKTKSIQKPIDSSSSEVKVAATPAMQPENVVSPTDGGGWSKFFLGVVVGFVLCALLIFFAARKKNRRSLKYRYRR